ncbi:hypothetical protein E8E14_000621 [Neopestalotiopsis sp. 37M]|nr:hypothetical protein E8E14_000621 [Neopestalotiopsis sp. 37M]
MARQACRIKASNAPGNPQPALKNLKTSPDIRKWKAVYKLGEHLSRFLSIYGTPALWVIPFDAIEAAFGRGLDTANTIYITTVLNFLAQNAEIGAFLQGLGKATHDQLLLLCEGKASDRVALLVYVETAITKFA